MKIISLILIALYSTIAISQFTAFPPMTTGTSTLDVNQAVIKGGIRYTQTASCNWANSLGSWQSLGAQVSCNLPTYFGDAIDIGAADNASKRVAVRFPSMKAGRYEFTARSLFYNSATAVSACSWSFYDGSNRTNPVEINTSGSHSVGVPEVSGEITYTSDQGDTTIELQSYASAGTPNCFVFSDNAARELEITVKYFPDSSTVFQSSCTGDSCHNTFTAEIGSGTINTSCTTDPCTVRSATPVSDWIADVDRASSTLR